MAKTTVHKVLILVSMDSLRSNELNGSQFWALECLLTASGWLESIRAIMAPPRVITSFQSSCEIGLRYLYNQVCFYKIFVKYHPRGHCTPAKTPVGHTGATSWIRQVPNLWTFLNDVTPMKIVANFQFWLR